MSDFKLYTALLSLVDKDYFPLKTLIKVHLDYLYSKGVDAVLVMGTTGEFPNFSITQRQRYLETVLELNPGMEIMVNIGATSLSDILSLQSHVLSLSGVHKILMMPPFYYPDTQINGLESIIAEVSSRQPEAVPFYLYHYPKISHINITPQILVHLPRIAGIKDTSGDFKRIGELTEQFPDREIYVGTDYEIQHSKHIGSAGIISGLANLFPELAHKAVDGDTVAEKILSGLRKKLDGFCKIPALKAYLNKMELESSRTVCTLPFKDLKEDESRHLCEALYTIIKEESSYAGC